LVVRELKPQPIDHGDRWEWRPEGSKEIQSGIWAPSYIWPRELDPGQTGAANIFDRCPLGRAGDEFWVREAWRVRGPHTDAYSPEEIAANRTHFEIAYCSSIEGNTDIYGEIRPASTMPRGLSRSTVVVQDVQCKPIQDVTEDEAVAAGLECHTDDGVRYFGPLGRGDCRFDVEFAKLHGSSAWAANAFHWFATIRRIEL
jgi:hypothetical protein